MQEGTLFHKEFFFLPEEMFLNESKKKVKIKPKKKFCKKKRLTEGKG